MPLGICTAKKRFVGGGGWGPGEGAEGWNGNSFLDTFVKVSLKRRACFLYSLFLGMREGSCFQGLYVFARCSTIEYNC